MLSRPAFSIRKLIPSPQKKHHDGPEDDEGSYFYHDDDDEMNALTRFKTWRPQMGLMKRSKASVDVRRSEDVLHRVTCISPLPDTPQSSTTSLSSIDNGSGYAVNTNPRFSLPRLPDISPLASPLLSPLMSPQRSPLLLPKQVEDQQHPPRASAAESTHPLQVPQLTPLLSLPQQADMACETPAPATVSTGQPTLLEAVTVTLPLATPGGANNGTVSSQDIRGLMPQAGEASGLVETVSRKRLSDLELDKFPKPKGPSPVSAPARRKSQRRSQGSVRSVKSPTKTPIKDPLLPAQARLPSSSRPKRAKSKKSRRRRPRASARQSSMWQLTESAKDLFTMRIFNKIEVDEMLPESTLREIRMSRAARWTMSPELGVTHIKVKPKGKEGKDGAATPPIEPLSLDESLDAAAGEDAGTPRASVINQAKAIRGEDGKTLTAPDRRQSKPTGEAAGGWADAEPQVEEPSPSVQQPDSPTTKPCDRGEEERNAPIVMVAEGMAAALPPPQLATSPMAPSLRTPTHRRLPSSQLPPLPTITEVVTTGAEKATLSPTSSAPQLPDTATKADTDDYVFLDSNPYTLTMPTFRHGRIRLAKADLPIGKLAAAVDDTLDWTAFQMAILGGAGDFFSEPTDYSRPSDAELDELEGLASWFGSFGFGGPGSLIGPSEPRTSLQPWIPVFPRTPTLSVPSPTSTPNSSPRTVVGSRSPAMWRIDRPATAGDECNQNQNKHGGSLSGSIADRIVSSPSLSPLGPGYSPGHRRSASSTTFEHKASKPKLAHSASFESRNHAGLSIDATRRPSVDSIQSLPPSPMMDLVVSHDVDGNEYIVPMGFNLSHDLGDYLTWQTEHVVGAGFGDGGGQI
ncbi:hypothetical protein VTH06DRAFT_853 [Thermothelomyces fergusii]